MSNSSSIAPGKLLVSQHGMAQVWKDETTGQHSLHAAKVFSAGEVISAFAPASVHITPSYLTVQTGSQQHITLQPEFLQYVNHSCQPNVFFDTDAMQLVCLEDVLPGEEFRFFYPSTEWDMAQPFVCNCGNNNCLQLITGAVHLSVDTLSRYRLSSFIKNQVKQKLSL